MLTTLVILCFWGAEKKSWLGNINWRDKYFSQKMSNLGLERSEIRAQIQNKILCNSTAGQKEKSREGTVVPFTFQIPRYPAAKEGGIGWISEAETLLGFVPQALIIRDQKKGESMG